MVGPGSQQSEKGGVLLPRGGFTFRTAFLQCHCDKTVVYQTLYVYYPFPFTPVVHIILGYISIKSEQELQVQLRGRAPDLA